MKSENRNVCCVVETLKKSPPKSFAKVEIIPFFKKEITPFYYLFAVMIYISLKTLFKKETVYSTVGWNQGLKSQKGCGASLNV